MPCPGTSIPAAMQTPSSGTRDRRRPRCPYFRPWKHRTSSISTIPSPEPEPAPRAPRRSRPPASLRPQPRPGGQIWGLGGRIAWVAGLS